MPATYELFLMEHVTSTDGPANAQQLFEAIFKLNRCSQLPSKCTRAKFYDWMHLLSFQ